MASAVFQNNEMRWSRYLDPWGQLLVELLLVPGCELDDEGGGDLALAPLLVLVPALGVEALQQNTNILVQLVPVSLKNWCKHECVYEIKLMNVWINN